MENLYNSKNFLVRFVHCQRLDVIVNSVCCNNGMRVLDAGCGEGQLIEKLYEKNKSNYYGADITEIALKKAKARCPFANFSEMNLADLKFEDGFFDVIIITEVLEHVIEYRAVVAELKRVLKKGGFLIVTFPNEFLWTVSRFLLGRRPIKVPDHVNSFNPSKIKKLIGMELITRKNLPFGGPFSFSLGGFMNFKK